ncbi:transposase [Wolbachia endosymbiont of Armadillidium vulgare str. wVulC]|nr:transposase [Wolbachia endosymbiont of Armadillidium vulgare str. wVulC]
MAGSSNFWHRSGQTVILDNTIFHKSIKIVEFAKSVDAEILSVFS